MSEQWSATLIGGQTRSAYSAASSPDFERYGRPRAITSLSDLREASQEGSCLRGSAKMSLGLHNHTCRLPGRIAILMPEGVVRDGGEVRLRTALRGDRGPAEKSARRPMHESDPGTRVAPTHVPPPGPLGESVGPHTLQILMTEHWSLLASRGFVYTETMGRTSIFVAALTGSVVALALVAQATDVGDSFVAFALVLLPVVYFLGVVTFVRLLQVNWEDTRWVQGMNRIRHAYLDLAPELEPYFVTSRYDDDMGILQSAVAMRKWPSPAQGFVAIPGVVGVIDSVVAGAIAGIAAVALDFGTGTALALGGLLFLVSLVGFVALGDRQIERFRSEIDPVFPSPPRDG